MKRVLAIALMLALSAAGQAKARDCAPFNGPYGYYGNPWCNEDSGNRGASSPKRSKRKPARKARSKPRPPKKVDTAKTPAEKRPAKAETRVEDENSSISSLETEPIEDRTPLEHETNPAAELAQTNTGTISAGEMSAAEWSDCAGHFYYVSQSMPESHEWKEGMGALGKMAAAAAGFREAADRGQEALKQFDQDFDVQQLIDKHLPNLSAYTNSETYMSAYRDKCFEPTVAFSDRLRAWLGQ